jgi:predicted dinucleotide-binding enzyme
MRITVLGAGRIGTTLAHAFAAAGHDVAVGTRSPGADLGSGLHTTEVASALSGAEVTVLAVPGPAVAGLVAAYADALAGTLVVDAANIVGGPGPAHSRAAVTEHVPAARYARAFNTLGVENFERPRFGAQRADLLVSCSDADLPVVTALVEAVGLNAVPLGEGTEDALDDALRLWFALSRRLGRHVALKVLHD